MQGHIGLIWYTDDGSLRSEAIVTNEGFRGSEVVVLNLSENVAFDKSREAFVEPDVFPIVGGDLVAGPLLRNFSHEHVLLTFIAHNSCLREVGEHGLGCATHRECRGHDHDIVGSPDKWSIDISLSGVENSLSPIPLLRGNLDNRRLSYNSCSWPE